MADDDIREGDPEKPRKKRPLPRDDDEEDDRPRRRRRDADDDGDDIGASPLSAVVPVGGSIWALLSFYLALFSCIIPIPLFGLLAVIFGILAFMTHKHTASYGSITGNIRAVLGILIGLVTMVGSSIVLFMLLSNPNAFK